MFAFSIPENIADVESLIVNIPIEDIPFIEVQGDKEDLLRFISQKKITIVNSYGYIDNSLLTNVIEQKGRLRDEVFDKLHCFITNPLAPEYITLDFGLLHKDVEGELNFLKIKHLHNLYKSIYNENKKICLPIRVPGNTESPQSILSVLRNLMLNKFRICLNIFPHELKNEEVILNLISGLQYNVGVIRLIYEPATGNYITESFVRFCLETLKKHSLRCPIIFAPTVNNVSLLDREVSNICILRKAIVI